MGAGSSSESYPGGSYGYHVISVTEGSPGHKAGLEPFFDYLVAIDGHRLNKVDSTLKDVLESNENRAVNLSVYNSKKDGCRDVAFTPTRTWGGQGLLGINIRFTSFQGANENVWHIMEVVPGSPAACAGLQSDVDYVIGSDQHMTDGDDICSLVENHDGKPLKLYVYSTVTDACREVTVTPNSNWGGEGMLGCDIGYGYLHRIPRSAVSIASAAASEAFTVTTGTLPHHQPVAGQQTSTSSDGFSDVPLGGAAPLQYSTASPGHQLPQPVPMQAPIAQPVFTSQQQQYASLPGQLPPLQAGGAVSMPGAPAADLAGGLAGLSLTGGASALPPYSGMQPAHAMPLVPGLEPVSMGAQQQQLATSSPLPSNAPPMSGPASVGVPSVGDMRQMTTMASPAPLAAVSPLTGNTPIPSYATQANVTVVRGQAAATVSPLPPAASSMASPVLLSSATQMAAVPPSTSPSVMAPPSIEIPPMPSIPFTGIPGFQLASSAPLTAAPPATDVAPPS